MKSLHAWLTSAYARLRTGPLSQWLRRDVGLPEEPMPCRDWWRFL